MYVQSIKILGKIKRKPDHFYYIDGLGNLVECVSPNTKHTFLERLKIKWIDLFHR